MLKMPLKINLDYPVHLQLLWSVMILWLGAHTMMTPTKRFFFLVSPEINKGQQRHARAVITMAVCELHI
jgi:hypothetical protein